MGNKDPIHSVPRKKSLWERLRTRPRGKVLEVGPHDLHGSEGPGNDRSLSLNEASEVDLSRPDFMDEATARQIIEVRERIGGFSAWEELREHAGLSVTTIADLQRSFRLDPVGQTHAAAREQETQNRA